MIKINCGLITFKMIFKRKKPQTHYRVIYPFKKQEYIVFILKNIIILLSRRQNHGWSEYSFRRFSRLCIFLPSFFFQKGSPALL